MTINRPFDGLSQNAVRFQARARTLARQHPREAIAIGALAFVAAVAIGSIAVVPEPAAAPAPHTAPPAPPPLILKAIAPQDAIKLNSEIPVTSGPNPAAAAFLFKGNEVAKTQALECLASAVYYEAGNQDESGERAVAQVVLNRVRHPAFPNSICGVVYEGSTRPTGCQFTFTCDGSLMREPDADGWQRAWKIAVDALSGYVFAPVGWATHYHADYVVPTWASSMAKNIVVGAQIFYRWPGSWGQPSSFTQSYAGHEPSAKALKIAALAVPHINPLSAQSQLAGAIKNIPGAEVLKITPSMRGDKRVGVRFNLVARKASDNAAHEDYDKAFDVSDNLKWSLSSDPVGQNQKPLGSSTTNSATPQPPATQH